MKPQPWSVSSGLFCLLVLGRLSVGTGDQIIFPNDTALGHDSPCRTSDNLWGVCTLAKFCPQVKREISSKDICSFVRDEAIICCVRSSELACNGFDVDNGQVFKVPPRSFFIGGVRATPRQHPHMAALGWSEGSSISWKCGASLISEEYLITAAHCTSVSGVAPDIARVGVINLVEENPNPPPADYNVTLILVHPDYKFSSTYNDIALIRIFPIRPIPSDIQPKPICLWPNREIPKSTLLAMGYGTLSFGGPQSNELFMGTLQYVPQNECKAAFEFLQNRRLAKGIIESQMCAQDLDGKRDTCQGDSGGPLQFTNESAIVNVNYIVGITSFGQGCLGATPGVYTRLHSYLDWIEQVVWSQFTIG